MDLPANGERVTSSSNLLDRGAGDSEKVEMARKIDGEGISGPATPSNEDDAHGRCCCCCPKGCLIM